MAMAPGFEPKLFASDPDIKKPICMAFDERGRLWVAETFDYPNEMQPQGKGHDQITICEDTKGDGRGGQVHGLCRQAEHPHQHGLRQRRA